MGRGAGAFFGTLFLNSGTKFFETKILPLSDCASRINFHYPAMLMIPVDRRGRGVPQATEFRPISGNFNRKHFLKIQWRARLPPTRNSISAQRFAL